MLIAQLEAVDENGTFEVVPRSGGKKGKKVRFQIISIEQANPASTATRDERLYVPYYFDARSSKIKIESSDTTPTQKATITPIELEFDGLRGLDEQLKQLRSHISRINTIMNEHSPYSRYSRPSPVLIHGPSG